MCFQICSWRINLATQISINGPAKGKAMGIGVWRGNKRRVHVFPFGLAHTCDRARIPVRFLARICGCARIPILIWRTPAAVHVFPFEFGAHLRRSACTDSLSVLAHTCRRARIHVRVWCTAGVFTGKQGKQSHGYKFVYEFVLFRLLFLNGVTMEPTNSYTNSQLFFIFEYENNENG
jgi:uncharacterized membrane protein YbjE (DUF340 family)